MTASNARKPSADPALKAVREVEITRVFDAPCELVWDAWTKPEQIVKWWGPRGFTLTIDEMDVRPGGVWKSTMHGPDGVEYVNNCLFTKVVKPERIDYQLTGGRKHPRDGQGPVRANVSFVFEAQGEKTKLTLRMLFATPEALERSAREYKVLEGGNEMLDRLTQYLGDRDR